MTLYEDWNQQNQTSLKTYPVKFKFDTQTIAINPLAPAVSQITQIIVKDILRNVTYTWQNGSWNQPPQVVVGTGNLYVSFTIVNNGGASANFALTIWNGLVILNSVTVPVAPGATGSVNVTTDMPNGTITLQLTSNP